MNGLTNEDDVIVIKDLVKVTAEGSTVSKV